MAQAAKGEIWETTLVGVEYKTWRGYAHSYHDVWWWKNTLDQALNHETDLCRFCYASLKDAGMKYVKPEREILKME